LMLRRLRQLRLTESTSRRSRNEFNGASVGVLLSLNTESLTSASGCWCSSTKHMLLLTRCDNSSSTTRLSTALDDSSSKAFMAVIRFCKWLMCISNDVE